METVRYDVGSGFGLVADRGGARDAPCVILMHGGGQTRQSWMAAGHALLDLGYQVINYDARGHGESDWAGAGGYSLARNAADLAAIADTVDAPIALVGASLGGATALHAIGAGLAVEVLVLVDIVPNPHPDGVARIREFMLARPEGYASLDEVADAVAAYNPHRRRPRDAQGLRRNLRLGDDGRYRWHWDPAFLGRDIDVEIGELAATLESARSAGDFPVLLIRGMESDVIDDAGLAQLREILPAMQVRGVVGAGHMVAGDDNDRFNAELRDFLTRHFPIARRTA